MTTKDIDIPKISASDAEPIVVEVYKYLKEYGDSPERAKWIKRRKAGWDAMQNEMWSAGEKEELKKKGMVDLVINKIVLGVQGASAIVTDSKPALNFLPKGSGDLYVSELMKRANDRVWDTLNINDLIYELVEETKVGGLGVQRTSLDESLGVFGSVDVENPCPTTLYFSEHSRKRDYSDSHLLLAQPRTREYIKENYPDLKDEDLNFKPAIEDGVESTGVTTEDNYTVDADGTTGKKDEKATIWEIEAWLRKKKLLFQVVVSENGEQEEVTEVLPLEISSKDAKGLAELKQAELREVDPSATVRIWERLALQLIKVVIVGKILISEEVNPHGEDADGRPVPELSVLKHNKTQSAYPVCPVFFAVPLNKEMNKRRIQFQHATSHNTDAPIVLPYGAKFENGPPGTPGSRIVMGKNETFKPYRLQTGSFGIEGYMRLEEKANSDIDDQFSIQDVMRGKAPPGDPSGRVVLALQDMGGTMSKPFLRALETLMISTGKTMMAIIMDTWPSYMWERLVEPEELGTWTPDGKLVVEEGEDQDAAEQEINQKWKQAIELVQSNQISLIDVDVKIVAGSSMPTNRVARAAEAREMVKIGVWDGEALLDYTDDPNKDKILARMKKAKEAELKAIAAGEAVKKTK